MKTLTKEFDTLQVNFAADEYSFDTSLPNSGWRQLSPGSGAFVNSTYFDLGGMTLEDETLFFEGATVQEILNPQFAPATAGDRMFVVDIMTKVPLTDDEVAAYAVSANMIATPSATLTFDQTIYGRIRFMNVDLDNAAGGFAILLSDNQTGSLSPSASDRIYCYRYASIKQQTPGFSTLYAARYILRATSKEEPEYEYLMRLKRSYELQNQPDRD